MLTFPVQTSGGLTEVEEFGKVIVKALPDGAVVRVRDVARVELGADDYQLQSRKNGAPAVSMGIYLRPGGNALALATAVRERMATLGGVLPDEVQWSVSYDTTKFVTASLELVEHTFIEALVLVLVVVYLFLGSMRATLIPLLAIPVSIVGTLAGMLLAGFSINMLTLFGMVLAIGIVVDDAIVVVEAVEKLMHDEGLSPRAAARKAMQGIGGAIVGVTAVICAVFVPIAFMPGVVGTLYKQFAVTITISTLLSAITALTLTPALCALILKPGHKPWLIQKFDAAFERVVAGYVWGVRGLLKRLLRALVIYACLIGGLVFLFKSIPTSFVPDEDKGSIFVAVDLPSASSPERTLAVLQKVEAVLKQEPTMQDFVSVTSFSIFYRYANQAFVFATLKPWEAREAADEHVGAVLRRLNMQFAGISEARVFALNEPPISGMGNTAGFDYRLVSYDGDRDKLNQALGKLLEAAGAEPAIRGTRNVGAPEVQTLFLDVDRNKAKAMGVPLQDLYATIGGLLGSSFVNQFTRFGTNLKVKLQAEERFRADPDVLKRYYARSLTGSGEALATMERLSATVLPEGVGYLWSGQSLQEKLAGSSAAGIFILSLIFVFLFLAALYESFALPVAVFLIVPIAILGALVALLLRQSPNDVFFQVSLITLVGLAGKNGILIVEFAKQRYEEGLSVMDAALEAAKARLRPIVMTSLAFILGVLPLVRASGAGAATQHSVGTGIMGGMIAATLIGVFFTPVFYVLVMKLRRTRREDKGAQA